MRKVRVIDALPGMMLAQPVVNEQGVTLAGAGRELTDRLIERFAQVEIDTIWVEATEELTDEQKAQLKEKIEHRFKDAGDSEAWLLLKAILIERIDARKQ